MNTSKGHSRRHFLVRMLKLAGVSVFATIALPARFWRYLSSEPASASERNLGIDDVMARRVRPLNRDELYRDHDLAG